MRESAKNSQRITYIDAAKGLAMYLIMASHLATLPIFITASYVAVFFFISGFTFRPTKRPTEAIRKRAQQLLIPYIYAELFYLAWQVIGDIHRGGTFDKQVFFKAVVGILSGRVSLYNLNADIPGNIFFWIWETGPLWFLLAFFTTSVLFYPLMEYVIRGKKQCALACLALILLAVPCSHIIFQVPWYLDALFSNTLIMIAGWLTAQKLTFELFQQVSVKKILGVLNISFAYVLLCLLNPGMAMSISSYGKRGVFLFWGVAITGSLLYIWVARAIELFVPMLGRFFALLGRHTIGLFCSHLFFYKIFRKVDVVLGTAEWASAHSLFAAFIKAGGACVCWIILYYFAAAVKKRTSCLYNLSKIEGPRNSKEK